MSVAPVCVHVCEGLVSLSMNQSASSGVDLSDVWRKGSAPKINNSREDWGKGEGWQAPGDPGGEKTLQLLTQRAKGVEGCSFPPPSLSSPGQAISSVCPLGALE